MGPLKARLSVDDVAGMLDLLVLSADTSATDLEHACRTAAEAHLSTVYCATGLVPEAATHLDASGVGVGTVLPGFDGTVDLGSTASAAERSLQDGASEIAVIVSNPWWRANGDAVLSGEIRALSELAGSRNAVLKVVFLTNDLDQAELFEGCRLAGEAGAAILQGGSWFTSDRATMAELQVMRSAAPPTVTVKGAGYIKSLDLLLLGYAHGLGRFNVHSVDKLLADAIHRAEGGDLVVPPAKHLSGHLVI